MLIGVGLDLAAAETWREVLGDPATGALAGTFTPRELAYAREATGDAGEHLAARFAAKEAFVKALGCSHLHIPPRIPKMDLREVEVVNDEYGRPYLVLHGQAKALADQMGVRRAWLSLTHEQSTAAVVLEG